MRATILTMAGLMLLTGATAANAQYSGDAYGYATPNTDIVRGYSTFDSRYGLGTRYGYGERFGFGTRYGYGNRYGNDPYVNRFGASTRYGYGDRYGYIPFDYDRRTAGLPAEAHPPVTPDRAPSYDLHSDRQPSYGAGPSTMPRATSTQRSEPAPR